MNCRGHVCQCPVMCKGVNAACLPVIVTVVMHVTSKDGLVAHCACISIELVGGQKSLLMVTDYFADDC